MSDAEQDQRKLPPTDKRRREFRERGEVALSRDLTSAATTVGAGLGLLLSVAEARLTSLMGMALHGLESPRQAIFTQGVAVFIYTFTPVALGGLVGYLTAAVVQLGWPPTFAKLGFNPARGLSWGALTQLFSPKEVAVRGLAALFKMAFVGLAAFLALKNNAAYFLSSRVRDPHTFGVAIWSTLRELALYAGGALVLLAIGDYLRNRYKLSERMKMTAEEYKREHREQEGDPMIKRQRQRRMRELSKGRMASVRTADVVLVNPTHYAVALRYRAGQDRAPIVLAKGCDQKAARIREIARRAGVAVVSQPPLTRLLYKVAPEGKAIPANLYHAVAEILAYVYRLKQRAHKPLTSRRSTLLQTKNSPKNSPRKS